MAVILLCEGCQLLIVENGNKRNNKIRINGSKQTKKQEANDKG